MNGPERTLESGGESPSTAMRFEGSAVLQLLTALVLCSRGSAAFLRPDS